MIVVCVKWIDGGGLVFRVRGVGLGLIVYECVFVVGVVLMWRIFVYVVFV